MLSGSAEKVHFSAQHFPQIQLSACSRLEACQYYFGAFQQLPERSLCFLGRLSSKLLLYWPLSSDKPILFGLETKPYRMWLSDFKKPCLQIHESRARRYSFKCCSKQSQPRCYLFLCFEALLVLERCYWLQQHQQLGYCLLVYSIFA